MKPNNLAEFFQKLASFQRKLKSILDNLSETKFQIQSFGFSLAKAESQCRILAVAPFSLNLHSFPRLIGGKTACLLPPIDLMSSQPEIFSYLLTKYLESQSFENL